jgi:hypothetical protein
MLGMNLTESGGLLSNSSHSILNIENIFLHVKTDYSRGQSDSERGCVLQIEFNLKIFFSKNGKIVEGGNSSLGGWEWLIGRAGMAHWEGGNSSLVTWQRR